MSSERKTLRWGVKRSLIGYLAGLDDAALVASDGAVADEDDVFSFQPDGAAHGVRRFRGRLAFTAHDGMLHIELADPWIEHDADGMLLSVFSPMDDRRVPMARLTESEDGWSAVLTLRGADVLGPQYSAGAQVDAVRIA